VNPKIYGPQYFTIQKRIWAFKLFWISKVHKDANYILAIKCMFFCVDHTWKKNVWIFNDVQLFDMGQPVVYIYLFLFHHFSLFTKPVTVFYHRSTWLVFIIAHILYTLFVPKCKENLTFSVKKWDTTISILILHKISKIHIKYFTFASTTIPFVQAQSIYFGSERYLSIQFTICKAHIYVYVCFLIFHHYKYDSYICFHMDILFHMCEYLWIKYTLFKEYLV
jgi:hypothetical protein